MKKALSTILNIIATIFVVLILLFALLNFNSAPKHHGLFGYKAYTVLSNSMNGTFDAGDYIIDKLTPYNELKKGAVISYLHDNNTIVTHRITSISPEGIRVKGDTNPNEDNVLVTEKNYLGEYRYRIPQMGNVSSQLGNPMVLVAVCVAIAFLLLLLLVKK